MWSHFRTSLRLKNRSPAMTSTSQFHPSPMNTTYLRDMACCKWHLLEQFSKTTSKLPKKISCATFCTLYARCLQNQAAFSTSACKELGLQQPTSNRQTTNTTFTAMHLHRSKSCPYFSQKYSCSDSYFEKVNWPIPHVVKMFSFVDIARKMPTLFSL